MRLIDADALESAITVLIFEFEHRAPKWSSNDMLTSSIDAAKKYGYKADGAEAVLNVIRRMPTVDAAPVKHGRWDIHDVVKILASGHTLDGFCQCEACGSIFSFNFSEYSFCPECGAKMDGEST